MSSATMNIMLGAAVDPLTSDTDDWMSSLMDAAAAAEAEHFINRMLHKMMLERTHRNISETHEINYVEVLPYAVSQSIID